MKYLKKVWAARSILNKQRYPNDIVKYVIMKGFHNHLTTKLLTMFYAKYKHGHNVNVANELYHTTLK